MKVLELLNEEVTTKELEKEVRVVAQSHGFTAHVTAANRKDGMKVVIAISPSAKAKDLPKFGDQDAWTIVQKKLWAKVFILLKSKGKVFVGSNRASAKPLTTINPLMITQPTRFAGPSVPDKVEKYKKPIVPTELHFWIE